MSDQINNPAQEPATGLQDVPMLTFGDEAGNPISEISLAPGEQKKIKLVLSKHPEAITQSFLAQWNVYDANHQLTSDITCMTDPDNKKWLTPLFLSTSDESVGGMSGNDLNSARFDNGTWRCMGKNPNGQFWYPRDMFITPVPVAEFTVMASSDWADKCATLELDNNFTKFTQTTDTTVPATSNYTAPCNYSMVLTIKNANAGNVTPPQDNSGSQVTPPSQDENDGQVTPPPQDNSGSIVQPEPSKSTTNQENAVSNTQVQLDILMKAWTLGQQKNVEVQFIYNTCRYEKDANGNTIKVSSRKRVNDVKLYNCSESHDIRYLSLEEGEYVDGKVILRVSSRISEAHIWQTHITALIDASTGKIGLIINGSSDRNHTVLIDQASSATLSDVKYLPISGSQDNNKANTAQQNNGEHIKKEEEEERKAQENRWKDQINELVNSYPIISIEDGFASPPRIQQNANEVGAWVRGLRESKSGIWFMLDENVNGQYIYPGNIIVADKEKKFTKKFVEIPFEAAERKPLQLDAKYSNEIKNNSAILNSFTRKDVNEFVNQCLTNFKSGSHDLASNTNWQYESSDRKEGLSIGGTIDGIKFSGSLFERNKTVTVAYLKQEMYTVSLNNEYSYASDLFTDKVDVEKFRRNLDINHEGGVPAIIDAVKYGRVIAIWVVQEGNQPAKLSVDDYFNLTVSNTNKSTTFHMRVYGGVASDNRFNKDTEKPEEIKNVLKQLKEVGKEEMEAAMPMEYSLKLLKNLTTNIEWQVRPYFKTYIPRVKFRVTENNTGASMKCAVYMLNYQPYGNNGLKYVKNQVDRKEVDYDCYPSPKALCIDIKIDVTCATDPFDFNIMLPCIPYERLEPDNNGDWVFQVNISGLTVGDKNAQCIPSLPGAILSTSNQIFMNNPKIYGAPLIKFADTDANEDEILNYYISWAKSIVGSSNNLRFLYGIDNIRQLRPQD